MKRGMNLVCLTRSITRGGQQQQQQQQQQVRLAKQKSEVRVANANYFDSPKRTVLLLSLLETGVGGSESPKIKEQQDDR